MPPPFRFKTVLRIINWFQGRRSSQISPSRTLGSCLLLCLLVSAGHGVAGELGSSTLKQCTDVATADFSGVQDAPARISSARTISPAAGDPPLCVVDGYVAPQVGFELKLPLSGWNRKLIAVGNYGWGGAVNEKSCDYHIKRGYACVASDTGHRAVGTDGLWAANNLAAQVDFGYRSVHVMTLAAKAIVARFYATDAARAYFIGCSTGGYEGLVEAQRFPWDFDGIIAGAPDMDEVELTMRELWSSRSFLGPSGEPLLDAKHIELLHKAVLSQCDQDDGVADGIVSNPLACKFDPSKLLCRSGQTTGCLSAEQIESVRRIYTGPPIPRAQTLVRGPLPGSELGWGSLGKTGVVLGDSLFRYMIYGASPEWTPANYDFSRDYKRLGMGAFYTDTNPDLRRFKSAGGKLIVFQGWTDVTEMPTAIADYYETVERTMGGRPATQEFFRLFMIPGMNHCGGGIGAYTIDYLSYLEAWVEEGRAPDHLLGGHIDDRFLNTLPQGVELPTPDVSHGRTEPNARVPITFTRPFYPYPFYARYTGTGDPDDATNFKPVE